MKFKSNVHIKMTPEERAKQFMPFAALKGYEEALRAMEKRVEMQAENKVESIKIDMLEYDSDFDFDAYEFGDQ